MNKLRILLSLAVVASAILFAVRHHSLRDLKFEQARLHQRSEEKSNLQSPAPSSQSPAPRTSSLSADERSELLRLRGQASALQRDLSDETNQLAKLSRSMRPPNNHASGEPVVSQAKAVQKMTQGRVLMIAIIQYAEGHNDQLPASLAEAATLINDGVETNDLELVQGIPVHLRAIQSPQSTFVLREKKPWRGVNDRWNRVYVFADGHSVVAKSDTPDFTEWEEKLKTQ